MKSIGQLLGRIALWLQLMLFNCALAYAQTPRAEADSTPVEPASPMVIIVSVGVFFGLCVYFVWMLIVNEKKRKQAGGDQDGRA